MVVLRPNSHLRHACAIVTLSMPHLFVCCLRHAGWTFDTTGACKRIPQIDDPKAHATACNSPRSCVKAYPTKVGSGRRCQRRSAVVTDRRHLL